MARSVAYSNGSPTVGNTKYVYSSLRLSFFPQPVVFASQGFKEAVRNLLFYFTVYEIYRDKSKSASVGYLHFLCSFPYVHLDCSFVLCGHLVQVALYLLVSKLK